LGSTCKLTTLNNENGATFGAIFNFSNQEHSYISITCQLFMSEPPPNGAPATAKKRPAPIENDLLPWLGKKPVAGITAAELLTKLQRTEKRGAKGTAHNGRQVTAQIFR
jgi:Phage integrase central domain